MGRWSDSLLVIVFSTLLAREVEPARRNIPVMRLDRSFLLECASPSAVRSVSLPCR